MLLPSPATQADASQHCLCTIGKYRKGLMRI